MIALDADIDFVNLVHLDDTPRDCEEHWLTGPKARVSET